MKFRAVIIFLISVFMIMSACSPRSDSSQPFKVTNLKESEPNDKAADALTVQDGSVVKGYIGLPQDQDWYHIHVPEDTSYILRAQLTGLPKMNLKMELFDAAKDELLDIDLNKQDAGEILSNYGLLPGDYYLRVRELWLKEKTKMANDSTFYVLKVTLQIPGNSLEFEPNNRGIIANPILPDVPVTGYLAPYGDEDWFKLDLPDTPNYYLEISVSGVENVNTKLGIYDPIEAEILSLDGAPKGQAEKIPNLGIDTTRAFYFLKVSATSKWATNTEQAYTLNVHFVSTPDRVEIEPNDRIVRATRLAGTDTVQGFIDTGKDVDWYQLTNTDTVAHVVRIENYGVRKVDLALQILDELEENQATIDDTGEMEAEIFPNLGIAPGVSYFIQVKNNASRGNTEEFYRLVTRSRRYYNDEEFEFNNMPEQASLLLPNRYVSGYIHPGGDVDFYRIELPHPRNKVDLVLRGILKVNTDLVLYDNEMTEIISANQRPAEETEKISIILKNGIYYLKVIGAEKNQCNYRDKYKLTATVRPIY
ncbi:hypothetical protein KAH55_06120 [bacterium]|nr:hypothetical protein [bacterium]